MPHREWFIVCFITGMISLIIEITGLRLLAPHFGNSVYMTGTLINTVLLGLALGYYLGGYTCQKTKNQKLPYLLLLSSALYLTILLLLKNQLIAFVSPLPFLIGIISISTALFLPPMIILGFISPYIIGMLEEKNLTGPLFALSTTGSIIGGILATFVLIPTLGSQLIMQSCILVLAIIGILGLAKSTKKILLLLPLFTIIFFLPETDGSLYTTESPYNIIYVKELFGRNILLLNDNTAMHSTSLDQKSKLSFAYYDYFLIAHLLHAAKKTLILGNGAGTSMTEVLYFTESEVDGVEIDKELTSVGKTYFDLDPSNTRATIYHQDARVFLQTINTTYDIIQVDLFSGSAYVPAHLATKEFFKQIKQHLRPGGIAAINMFSIFIDEEVGKRYVQTIHAEFPSVYLSGSMIYAFETPTTQQHLVTTLQSLELSESLSYVREQFFKEFKEIEPDPSIPVFTDDYVPIESLTYAVLQR